MRCLGLAACAASFAFLAQPASAVVYDFRSSETSALSSGPVVFDFSLDTATALVSGANTSFGDVTIRRDGTPVPGNTVGASFTSNLGSPLFYFVDTGARPFYTGIGTGIRFNTGSFAIADGATDGIGTLEISGRAIGAVPEPSTWATLLLGFATIGLSLRLAGRRGKVSDPA